MPRIKRKRRGGHGSYRKRKRRVGLARNPRFASAYKTSFTKKAGRPVKLGRGLPDAVLTRLKYTEVIANQAGAGTTPDIQTYQSSLHDPNLTGVGHQPYYYDQLSELWEHYVVYGFSYRITAANNSSTVQAKMVIAMGDADTSWAGDDLSELVNAGRPVTLDVKGSGQSIKYLSGYCEVAAVLGVPKSKISNNTSYRGTTSSGGGSANPNDTVKLQIITMPFDGSATTDVDLNVELIYHCKFYDLAEIASS